MHWIQQLDVFGNPVSMVFTDNAFKIYTPYRLYIGSQMNENY